MQAMKWILQYVCEHPEEFNQSRNEIIYTLVNYIADVDSSRPATFYLLMHTLREAVLVDKAQCNFDDLPVLVDHLYEVEEKRKAYIEMMRKRKLQCGCLQEDPVALEKRVEHIIVALKREIVLHEIQKTPFNAAKCIATLHFFFPLVSTTDLDGPIHPRPRYRQLLKYSISPRTTLHELIIEVERHVEKAAKEKEEKYKQNESCSGSSSARSCSPEPANDPVDVLATCEPLHHQMTQIGWHSICKSLASYLDTVDRHVKEMEAVLFPLEQEYKSMGISEAECVLERLLKYDFYTSNATPLPKSLPATTSHLAPLTTWPVPQLPSTRIKRTIADDTDDIDHDSITSSPGSKRARRAESDDLEGLTQLSHISATPPSTARGVKA
ncbi:hypothetical protein BC937DRAFT_93628 [Endogone sp. FLAS-F59071]|nr:hypothetical protein BC937DRAFT_93628 [Endogone sp. FLAS-F59071]|eukprot:RUS14568.1 hypothetical protein BC937DRAFT_93628 [Endogone sp. FLAS-F59071]